MFFLLSSFSKPGTRTEFKALVYHLQPRFLQPNCYFCLIRPYLFPETVDIPFELVTLTKDIPAKPMHAGASVYTST